MAGTASRRLNFRENSDLSDISPLSPSTEEEDENHPPNTTPKKNVTPLKGMKGLSTLSLDSPVRVYSEGHSKVRGVHSLRCTSPTEIPVSRFYGSQTEPRNPSKSWLRDVIPKAKTKLFLDDIPTNKKRSRTSSGQKIQPPPKRMRKHTVRTKRTLTFVPRLGQKAPIKRRKKKTPERESRKRRRTVSPEGSTTVRNKSGSRTPSSKAPKAKVIYKEHEDDEDGCGSWDITFTKRSTSTDRCIEMKNNKFFKTGNKKIDSKAVLTPPSSNRKQRSLCRPDRLYMSPVKGAPPSPLRRSPRKKAESAVSPDVSPRKGSPRKSPRKVSESPRKRAMLTAAREMVRDIEEMMQDEPAAEASAEITSLLDNLSRDEIKTARPSLKDLSAALPSPDEEGHEMNGHADDESAKLFAVFQPGHGKRQISVGSSPQSCSKSDSKRRSKLMGMGVDQYQIDQGQKGLCETTCPLCGLFYSKGCPEDEILHEKFCNSSSLFAYKSWKRERVVGRKGLDKVIRIQPGDSQAWWNKVQNIVSLVDGLLGFPPVKLEDADEPIVYLYVSGDKICGCLVTESIQSGYRLLTGAEECGVDQCDDEAVPVRTGISRLWVHPLARRRRIATSMLNSFRGNYCYGVILKKDDIAISVPTDDGKKFFADYMGRPDYLVYL